MEETTSFNFECSIVHSNNFLKNNIVLAVRISEKKSLQKWRQFLILGLRFNNAMQRRQRLEIFKKILSLAHIKDGKFQ